MQRDDAFTDGLELAIAGAVSESDRAGLAGFWCDGVLLDDWNGPPEPIFGTVFLGTDGQDRYELTVQPGPRAQSRYDRKLPLLPTIPSGPPYDWIIIDPEEGRVQIRLY